MKIILACVDFIYQICKLPDSQPLFKYKTIYFLGWKTQYSESKWAFNSLMQQLSHPLLFFLTIFINSYLTSPPPKPWFSEIKALKLIQFQLDVCMWKPEIEYILRKLFLSQYCIASKYGMHEIMLELHMPTFQMITYANKL